MFRNYLKIFISVTRQNRLFTLLSVFGISLTIMFIMIISMTFENILNGSGPEEEADQILYAWRLKVTGKDENQKYYNAGALDQSFYTDYFNDLKSPEFVSLIRESIWEFIYKGNRYQEVCIKTDGRFWQIYDFDFVEGRPFIQEEVENKNNFAVISESLKELFFGDEESVCGRTVEYNNLQLVIVGVVRDVPATALNTQASLYIPYNLVPVNSYGTYTGGYQIVFKAKTRKDKPAIVAEVQEVIRRMNAAEEEQRLFLPGPNSDLDRLLIGYGDPEVYSGRTKPLFLFFGKILGILLLPAINLMALNFSRMRERAEEIGVRKTFGATSSIIQRQFVFENIMLTLLGGLAGILFSYLVVALFGSEIHLPIDSYRSVEINYSFNALIFLVALVSCLLFALLSGVLPAARMSRLKPAEILKGGEL